MDAIEITRNFLTAAKKALEMCETEMRYAGWMHKDPENVGRIEAYQAVCRALHIAEPGHE